MKKVMLLVLVVFGLWPRGPATEAPREGLGERLLGPVASLVASACWVRFDLALRDGEPGRAYALAEFALDLEPGAWQGWSNLALHLAFDRASAEVEPDPQQRRRWIEVGLEVLERGIEHVRRPEELHLIAGLVRAAYVGPQAEVLAWPGGGVGALRAALRNFEQAEALGQPRAAALALEARAILAVLERGERPESWAEPSEGG